MHLYTRSGGRQSHLIECPSSNKVTTLPNEPCRYQARPDIFIENMNRRQILISAGVASFLVAIFHAVISLSQRWSLYWGATPSIAGNYVLLVGLGEFAALVLYTMRGLAVVPQILIMTGSISSGEPVPVRMLFSSIVSLAIGVTYLAGTYGCLGRRAHTVAK